MKINRFSPLAIGTKILLSNRVVIPAMASETADEQGFTTQTTLDHYSRLSQASASLVIVEYSFVHWSGRSEANQLGIHTDETITGLKNISSRIRAAGSVAGVQLTHALGKTHREFSGDVILGPSNVIVPVKDELMEAPKEMSADEIKELHSWFLAAADRAVASEFQLIELHAAHGYGLNQFLSPYTNKRTDAWGGSNLKRSKIITDIVKAVKAKYPDLLISVRIPGQDHLEGGLTITDSIEISEILKEAGVDILSVSSGIGGWRRPRNRDGEGYLVEEARTIQKSTILPVIGVGGIESGNYIDLSLNERAFSLAAVGRAILKDPLEWGRSHLLA